MKMLIDFHSKDELSILIEYTGRYPFPDNDMSELFLFSCFTLRQLYNMEQHLVAKALSGILVSDKTLRDLLLDTPKLPPGKILLENIFGFVNFGYHPTMTPKEALAMKMKLSEELQYNNSLMSILDNEFLSKLPNFVNRKISGDKSFEVSMPPFVLKPKGFGFLGREIPYYVFHSVVGLIRYLGRKHINDEEYLNYFSKLAVLCGTAHIYKQIPPDQTKLTYEFLKQIDLG